MKVIWSDFASDTLISIYQYYKEAAIINVARKIKADIFKSTQKLIKNPESGPIELSLNAIGEGHRFLVVGNYKIVYKRVREGILITDVFDARQDPIKINDEERNIKK